MNKVPNSCSAWAYVVHAGRQRPIRVHGSFVKDQEVEKLSEYLKAQKEPEYVEGVTEGELNVKDSGAVLIKRQWAAATTISIIRQ